MQFLSNIYGIVWKISSKKFHNSEEILQKYIFMGTCFSKTKYTDTPRILNENFQLKVKIICQQDSIAIFIKKLS